jgi:hypothetical protein
MAILMHEVWEEAGEDGGWETLGVCLAGHDGDGFRAQLGPNKRLVRTFAAGSHFEALTIHYAANGWGTYTNDDPWAREPYPEEWARRQSMP